MSEQTVYVLIHAIWDDEYKKKGENPKISVVGVYKDRLEAEAEWQKIETAYCAQERDNTRYNNDTWIVNNHKEYIVIQETILYE